MPDPIVPAVQPPVVSDDGKPDPNTPPAPEHVPYSKFRELLDEKKREQAEKRALADRIADYDKKDKEKEEELAKKRGDFDKIIQTRDQEIDNLKKEKSAFVAEQEHLKKLTHFVKTAGAEIDQKWFRMVDLSSIAIDPSTGAVDQMSVAQTVENFKKTWPEAFKPSGARIPTETPNGSPNNPGKIKYADYCKLPVEKMRLVKYSDIEH